MRRLAPGLFVHDAPQRFLGLEMGARMTVLQLSGGTLVHGPLAVSKTVLPEPEDLRWVVAPNLFHHLHLAPWVDVAPVSLAAPGLQSKRPDLAFGGVLVFHIQPDAPLPTRAAMALLGGYPGCCVTTLERWGMDRAVARTELKHLLSLDFDRLVMAHGAVIDTGGKTALEAAFRWLWR